MFFDAFSEAMAYCLMLLSPFIIHAAIRLTIGLIEDLKKWLSQ